MTLAKCLPCQIEFTAMRDQYMRCGEGFLICYSLTDRRSFEEVAGYKKLITKVRAADSIPIVLVGNKVDLDDRKVRQTTSCNPFMIPSVL